MSIFPIRQAFWKLRSENSGEVRECWNDRSNNKAPRVIGKLSVWPCPKVISLQLRNLEGILNAIRLAQAPYKFTRAFLETLGFKTNADRLIISVLKSLGFLDEGGRPTQRYFEYPDRTQSELVMADAVRDAYADLFKINIKANEMSKQDVISKLKMLSQGKISESVLTKMAMTFAALVKQGDFSSAAKRKANGELKSPKEDQDPPSKQPNDEKGLNPGRFVYKVQIVLPESRDEAVYDALFQSLRNHFTMTEPPVA